MSQEASGLEPNAEVGISPAPRTSRPPSGLDVAAGLRYPESPGSNEIIGEGA